MAKILGIDLGTTNSAMAVMEGGEPKIIENAEGVRTTPSVIAVSKNGERLVGLLAKRQAVTNPKNTLFGIKRLIGHRFDDEGVIRDKKNVSFTIERADNDGVKVDMGGKWYRPEEISAMVLQKLKVDAEAKVGEKIIEAVITVPAYFNDSQRKATKDAGKIAGFDVKRIINEPTAASLAYGLDKKGEDKVLVFDFGGGTFDVSILELGDGVFEVKSTNGDNHLGGDDIDDLVIDYLAKEFKNQNGIDLREDLSAMQRLRESAEKAKIELSGMQQTQINIPFITSNANGPKHLDVTLTRAKLESLCSDIWKRLEGPTKQAFKDAKLEAKDLGKLILVGGSTRIPRVQS